MKKLLFLLVIVGLLAAYLERDRLFPAPATPEQKPRRLAPVGTFFMVEYVSARTKNGVTGFVPGQQVKFVSADQVKGTLLVSDGGVEVAVSPKQLTNDLDVADLARHQDEQSQNALLAIQRSAQQADQKMQQKVAIEQSKDLAKVRTSSTVGNSPLDAGALPASRSDHSTNGAVNGSPYSYLHPTH